MLGIKPEAEDQGPSRERVFVSPSYDAGEKPFLWESDSQPHQHPLCPFLGLEVGVTSLSGGFQRCVLHLKTLQGQP